MCKHIRNCLVFHQQREREKTRGRKIVHRRSHGHRCMTRAACVGIERVREPYDIAKSHFTPTKRYRIRHLTDACQRNTVGASVRRACNVSGKVIIENLTITHTSLDPSIFMKKSGGASNGIPLVPSGVFCRLGSLKLLYNCATNPEIPSMSPGKIENSSGPKG